MKELLELERKLWAMTPREIHEYAKENYPDHPPVGLGKKKLVVRMILNLEREKLNKIENES